MTEVVMAVKVLLADDSQVIRQGIKNLFEYHPGITLVGVAETLDEAFTKSAELVPDVVVLADIHQRHIPDAALDTAVVRPMQAGSLGSLFLIDLLFLAYATDGAAKPDANIE
jgi:DNA-binding NarL/FixJ family response regulator